MLLDVIGCYYCLHATFWQQQSEIDVILASLLELGVFARFQTYPDVHRFLRSPKPCDEAFSPSPSMPQTTLRRSGCLLWP